jgi:hypothetical protein
MKQLFENLGRFFSKERLVMAGVLVLVLGLEAWTWFVRYPLIAVKQHELAQIQDLMDEVARLQSRWTNGEADRNNLASKLKLTYQHLFEGDPGASAWSTQIENPPGTLSFIVRAEKALPDRTYPERLMMLPTLWMVKNPAEDPNSLENLLSFLRDLTMRQPKWIELVEVLISGNEVTTTRAEFSLRLWFKKEPLS